MVRTNSTMMALGTKAPPFTLINVDGRTVTLAEFEEKPVLLVMFICNHCPYVKTVLDKIVRDTDALRAMGVNSVAIMSNDPSEYAEDSFEHMKALSIRHRFGFPYVLDDTQRVAKGYGAVCTPDFFGFDRDLRLAYRGRLDASGRSPNPDAPRELFDAMSAVAHGHPAPLLQHPSVGCSITWKAIA